MKLNNKLLILPVVAGMTAAAMVGCSEETSLSGAKAVYIEISPSSNIVMHLGDTTRVSACVTNVNGDVIKTPITWTVDDGTAVEIIPDSVPGSTLLTCGDGSQGKSTKIRATLENNDYAVATVTIVKAVPAGVNPVDEEGNVISELRTWNSVHDSIIFAVSPTQLLYDYDPVCNFDGLVPYGDNGGVEVDRKHGRVIMHYSSPRVSHDHNLSVTVGSGGGAKSGSCLVRVIPPVEGASFYGPSYAGLPYIEGRPPQGTLSMWYAYTYENTIDVNSSDTVRVAINVSTGIKEDIEQAYGCYHWEAVEGSSVMKIVDRQDFVESNGFDAVLAVRSGLSTGTTVFHCVTPDTTLVAIFNVRDFAKEFPVNSITCSHTSLELMAGVANSVTIKMGTQPMSSFGYHKPKAKIDNPEIVQVSDYNGDVLTITGLRPGTTNIRFTSNKAPEFVLPVTVTESYRVITYDRSDVQNIFVGQSTVWNTSVTTQSGLPNQQQVKFTSDDASIATVGTVSGSISQAKVTGVAAGRVGIKAEIGNVNVSRNINVVALPESATFTEAGTMAIGKSGSNLYVRFPNNARVTFTGAYVSGYPGTYNVADFTTEFTLTNAAAPVVSGTLTVADGSASNKKIVSFNFVVEFADGVRRTYSASNLEITSY